MPDPTASRRVRVAAGCAAILAAALATVPSLAEVSTFTCTQEELGTRFYGGAKSADFRLAESTGAGLTYTARADITGYAFPKPVPVTIDCHLGSTTQAPVNGEYRVSVNCEATGEDGRKVAGAPQIILVEAKADAGPFESPAVQQAIPAKACSAAASAIRFVR